MAIEDIKYCCKLWVKSRDYSNLTNVEGDLAGFQSAIGDEYEAFVLGAYIHSGTSFKTGDHRCIFDSGTLGFIGVLKGTNPDKIWSRNKMKKLSDSELGTLYLRVEKTIVGGHYFFEELSNELRKEINKRNWSKIYTVCCRVAKNRYHRNQFSVAKDYADAILNDCNYFEDLRSWELRGYETKSGNPYQIDLVCYNCTI